MKNFKINELTKHEKRITVYTLQNDFSVEVERNGDLTEFHLVNKAYGDKMHMFALPNCHEDVVEDIIRANAEDYIEIFFEYYGES